VLQFVGLALLSLVISQLYEYTDMRGDVKLRGLLLLPLLYKTDYDTSVDPFLIGFVLFFVVTSIYFLFTKTGRFWLKRYVFFWKPWE